MAHTEQKVQAASVTDLEALKAHPSDILHLVKLHISIPSAKALPSGTQLFKCMCLWKTFLVQTTAFLSLASIGSWPYQTKYILHYDINNGAVELRAHTSVPRGPAFVSQQHISHLTISCKSASWGFSNLSLSPQGTYLYTHVYRCIQIHT